MNRMGRIGLDVGLWLAGTAVVLALLAFVSG